MRRSLQAEQFREKKAWPLPNTWHQIQKASGHNFYTTLDLLDGFWQVANSKESIEQTGFTTHSGHYEFIVMPFGLTGSPAKFEQIMQHISTGCKSFIARLLDDMLIFSQTDEEYQKHVGLVLEQLYRFGFTLQLRKCAWFQPSVTFLGFIVSKSGIRPDPKKVSAILNRPNPTTITELRSLLNATGYL